MANKDQWSYIQVYISSYVYNYAHTFMYTQIHECVVQIIITYNKSI